MSAAPATSTGSTGYTIKDTELVKLLEEMETTEAIFYFWEIVCISP